MRSKNDPFPVRVKITGKNKICMNTYGIQNNKPSDESQTKILDHIIIKALMEVYKDLAIEAYDNPLPPILNMYETLFAERIGGYKPQYQKEEP